MAFNTKKTLYFSIVFGAFLIVVAGVITFSIYKFAVRTEKKSGGGEEPINTHIERTNTLDQPNFTPTVMADSLDKIRKAKSKEDLIEGLEGLFIDKVSLEEMSKNKDLPETERVVLKKVLDAHSSLGKIVTDLKHGTTKDLTAFKSSLDTITNALGMEEPHFDILNDIKEDKTANHVPVLPHNPVVNNPDPQQQLPERIPPQNGTEDPEKNKTEEFKKTYKSLYENEGGVDFNKPEILTLLENFKKSSKDVKKDQLGLTDEQEQRFDSVIKLANEQGVIRTIKDNLGKSDSMDPAVHDVFDKYKTVVKESDKWLDNNPLAEEDENQKKAKDFKDEYETFVQSPGMIDFSDVTKAEEIIKKFAQLEQDVIDILDYKDDEKIHFDKIRRLGNSQADLDLIKNNWSATDRTEVDVSVWNAVDTYKSILKGSTQWLQAHPKRTTTNSTSRPIDKLESLLRDSSRCCYLKIGDSDTTGPPRPGDRCELLFICKMNHGELDQLVNFDGDENSFKALFPGILSSNALRLYQHVRPFVEMINRIGSTRPIPVEITNAYNAHSLIVKDYLEDEIYNDLVTKYTNATRDQTIFEDRDWTKKKFNINDLNDRRIVSDYNDRNECNSESAKRLRPHVQKLKKAIVAFEPILIDPNYVPNDTDLVKFNLLTTEDIFKEYVDVDVINAHLAERELLRVKNTKEFHSCYENALTDLINDVINSTTDIQRLAARDKFLPAINACITKSACKPGVSPPSELRNPLKISTEEEKNASILFLGKIILKFFKQFRENEIIRGLEANDSNVFPNAMITYNQMRIFNPILPQLSVEEFRQMAFTEICEGVSKFLHEIVTTEKADEAYKKLSIISKILPEGKNIGENLALLKLVLHDIPLKLTALDEPEVAEFLNRDYLFNALCKTNKVDQTVECMIDFETTRALCTNSNSDIIQMVNLPNKSKSLNDFLVAAHDVDKWWQIQEIANSQVAEAGSTTYDRRTFKRGPDGFLKVPNDINIPPNLQHDWTLLIEKVNREASLSSAGDIDSIARNVFQRNYSDGRYLLDKTYTSKKNEFIGLLIEQLGNKSNNVPGLSS